MFKKNIEESKGAISHIWNEEKWRLPPFYKMQKREKAGERKVCSAIDDQRRKGRNGRKAICTKR